MNAPPQTGTEAIAAVATSAASVSDVAAGCLEKVRELDGAIGAFRVIDGDAVRSRAKELDDRVAGPLQGLMVGVKDVIDTADLPTGYGSPLFSDHRPSAGWRAGRGCGRPRPGSGPRPPGARCQRLWAGPGA